MGRESVPASLNKMNGLRLRNVPLIVLNANICEAGVDHAVLCFPAERFLPCEQPIDLPHPMVPIQNHKQERREPPCIPCAFYRTQVDDDAPEVENAGTPRTRRNDRQAS